MINNLLRHLYLHVLPRSLTHLPPWMIRLMYLEQIVAIDVGVDLGGGKVGVTEHFLNGAKVSSPFE